MTGCRGLDGLDGQDGRGGFDGDPPEARDRPPSPLPVDSLDMWGLAASLPEQVADALTAAYDAPLPSRGAVDQVMAIGMGGSGIAGDVAAAATATRLRVPFTVVKSYDPPASVGPGTLVFAVSCSGDTEETVAASTVCWEAGATVVVVAGGGELTRLAQSAGAPVVPVPADIPQPRAAIGAMSIPPLVLLGRLGLVEDQRSRIEATVEQLARRRDRLVGAGSPAQAVARRIGRTFPLVHGSPGLGGVAAQRWKCQVNENAKAPAFWSVHPELCHNEVAGWGQSGDVTRQILTLVALRHSGEHPQVAARFALVTELLREVVADAVEVWAEGQDDLAQLFDLVLFGDFVSLHLAGNEGIDPGPVPVLGELKAQLAGPPG